MKKLIFAIGLIICVLAMNINVQAQNIRMSSRAKGALIGGAGGALLGGLLGHNVKGALLGAAIGAGGGYVIANEHERNVQRREAAYDRGYETGYHRAYNTSYGRGYNTGYRRAEYHTAYREASYRHPRRYYY